ncbi:RNA polymerase sigma factor [Paenibacillus silvisoli]|uniref:RNA polymerase sigma factor n=1 Tax=Paenibacillus silvisoli TaxID=3110539 RepID=UPI0028054360|nr:RNA polymerase sigma factor [Paenibacillus silvisoli]
MYELSMDEMLVAKAREGDGTAFEELVRRHRDKACLWARAVTKDPHLAEDVVQEAMMKSFLRIGTLSDIGRFLPWLRRIVHNQALRSMRRGGPFGKEWPVSEFLPSSGNERLRHGVNMEAWPAMTPSGQTLHAKEGNPSELLLHREVLLAIGDLVKRLAPAERAIFEAYFYEELTAQEISHLLSVSKASVYMSLSRSRKKLQSGEVFAMRAGRRAVLSKPGILHSWTGLYNESIRNCIYYALPYTGKGELSYDEVMAYTGHAWLINLERRSMDRSGVYMYGETTMFPIGLLNLGLHSSFIDKFGYEHMPEGAIKEELYTFTLDMIRDSIDRGVPAIFPSSANSQFALYYGYDDGRQIFYAADTLTEMEIPYATFRNRHLYGFVIEEGEALSARERMRRMLATAVRHGRGDEPTFGGYVNGLEAYACWIRAWEEGTVDPAGQEASIRNVGAMRGHAASFLRKRHIELAASDDPVEREMAPFIGEAADRYEEVSEAIFALREAKSAETAIPLIRSAQTAERCGIEALEVVLERLNADKNGIAPVFVQANPMWIL